MVSKITLKDCYNNINNVNHNINIARHFTATPIYFKKRKSPEEKVSKFIKTMFETKLDIYEE